MWQTIYKSVDRITEVMAWLAGGSILLIALMQVVEILSRNLLGISLTFVWEFAAYLHISAIFMGLAFTLRTGGHIQVTLFANAFPKAFNYISTLVGFLISAYLSYAVIGLAVNWASTGRSSGTVDDLPLIYPMIFVALGAVFLTLQLLLRLFHLALNTPHETPWHNSPSAE